LMVPDMQNHYSLPNCSLRKIWSRTVLSHVRLRQMELIF